MKIAMWHAVVLDNDVAEAIEANKGDSVDRAANIT